MILLLQLITWIYNNKINTTINQIIVNIYYLGDEGFDPLGFSTIQEVGIDLYWLREAELKHARIAMIASLGFIAQEVEKVLPEVVQTEKNAEGYKSVQYDKIVALLVEAIKDQQKQINSLKAELKKQRKKRK
jgi:hypothetical protein